MRVDEFRVEAFQGFYSGALLEFFTHGRGGGTAHLRKAGGLCGQREQGIAQCLPVVFRREEPGHAVRDGFGNSAV